MLTTLLVFVFVVGPIVRWGLRAGEGAGWNDWGQRRARGGRRSPGLDAALEERDVIISTLESRVAELENRLDFAERVLSSRNGDGLLQSDPRGTSPTGVR